MPNRIIKESIRTSKSVNAMSDFQFRLWAYLITYVDDFGRGSADPELLKGFVFPRRKGITEDTIRKTLAELAIIGSVILYEVDGEPYLCFPNWSEHQTVRNKVSKYPSPEDGIITSASNCKQLKSIESKCPRNPIQSESNPNPEANARTRDPSGEKCQTLRSICDSYAEGGPVRDALDGFVEMRKKDKKGFTVRALQLSLKKLDNLSASYGDRAEEAKAAILDQSVQRGWAGLFDLKEPLPEKAPVIHHEEMPKPLTADEVRTRSLEDLLG